MEWHVQSLTRFKNDAYKFCKCHEKYHTLTLTHTHTRTKNTTDVYNSRSRSFFLNRCFFVIQSLNR